MAIDAGAVTQTALAILTAVGLKVLGAIALFIIGRWLIKLCGSLLTRALNRQQFDSTIVNYIRSSLSVLLNIVLVVALLGYLGVETATFAALLAGIGIAIGAAWSGLLSNFAAGLFPLSCVRSRSETSSVPEALPARWSRSACLGQPSILPITLSPSWVTARSLRTRFRISVPMTTAA